MARPTPAAWPDSAVGPATMGSSYTVMVLMTEPIGSSGSLLLPAAEARAAYRMRPATVGGTATSTARRRHRGPVAVVVDDRPRRRRGRWPARAPPIWRPRPGRHPLGEDRLRPRPLTMRSSARRRWCRAGTSAGRPRPSRPRPQPQQAHPGPPWPRRRRGTRRPPAGGLLTSDPRPRARRTCAGAPTSPCTHRHGRPKAGPPVAPQSDRRERRHPLRHGLDPPLGSPRRRARAGERPRSLRTTSDPGRSA